MTSFSSFPLLRCVLVAAALLCSFRGTTALSLLGRKSTANQVLTYLQQNDQLAPFVSQGGTAVITGGNSGIGAETVKALVASGMNVVVCARNVDSANQLKDELGTATKDRVDIEYLDLSSLASVQEAAASICSKHDGIDVLINNAGIMALPQRETTADGIEKQFGTNHVGHHYLTRLLLPQMRNKGRVVNVASTAHNFGLSAGNEDWESKESYTPWGAYGTSKLSNILFTKQLKKELVSENQGKMIDSVCLHPGVIASPLWKHSLPSFMQPLVGLIANKSVEQGAATSVYCALSRHVEDGAYYDDCSPVEPSQKAQSDQLQEALWMYTEQLLTEKGFELPSSSVGAENVAAVN